MELLVLKFVLPHNFACGICDFGEMAEKG